MVRKIITPDSSLVTVQLPENMVGKTVELLAFEIEPVLTNSETTKPERLKMIEELTAGSLVDLSGFRFNRDKANDYDE